MKFGLLSKKNIKRTKKKIKEYVKFIDNVLESEKYCEENDYKINYVGFLSTSIKSSLVKDKATFKVISSALDEVPRKYRTIKIKNREYYICKLESKILLLKSIRSVYKFRSNFEKVCKNSQSTRLN